MAMLRPRVMASCADWDARRRDISLVSTKFSLLRWQRITTVTGRSCQAKFRGFTVAILNSRPSSATNQSIRTVAITKAWRNRGAPKLFTNRLTAPVSGVTGNAIRTGGRVNVESQENSHAARNRRLDADLLSRRLLLFEAGR